MDTQNNSTRRAFLRKVGLTGAAVGGVALGLAVATPAEAGTSIHDRARVVGGWSTGSPYQGLCPCGWGGNKFPFWKPGAKAGAQGEVNWHRNKPRP